MPDAPTLVPPAAPGTGSGAGAARAGAAAFDPEAPWALHERVALRPERFGALAYHFGTRRLSFLKSPTLLRVVQALAEHPTAREACRAECADDLDAHRHERALATLAATDMIRRRDVRMEPA